MFKTIRTLAVIAIATGVLALGLPLATDAADMSVIEKRKAIMKDVVLKNFAVVKDFAQKGTGSAADVKAAADVLAATAPKIAALFPEDTGRPEVDAKMTRAKPEIWLDWEGFEKAAKALEVEAMKLSAVAAGGDANAIKAQFAATGKNGCGGCHKDFRGDKVQ